MKSSHWCGNKSIVAKNEVLNHTSCFIIAFGVLHYAETLLCLFNVMKQHRVKSLSRGLTPFFIMYSFLSCRHVSFFCYRWIFPMSHFKPRAPLVCTLKKILVAYDIFFLLSQHQDEQIWAVYSSEPFYKPTHTQTNPHTFYV